MVTDGGLHDTLFPDLVHLDAGQIWINDTLMGQGAGQLAQFAADAYPWQDNELFAHRFSFKRRRSLQGMLILRRRHYMGYPIKTRGWNWGCAGNRNV
jgi:hypothetical protein